jgi:hypothetical protein
MPLPSHDDRSGERQSLDLIIDWHRGIVKSLVLHRITIQHAIRTGGSVGARFVSMTDDEALEYFDAQRRELNLLTVLNLVASTEASIRIDYFRRVRGRFKDTLALAYRAWHKELSASKQLRPDFDEGGILEVLKGCNVMDNNIVGQYRECLRPRHWVGHGRYWARPVEADRFDPDDVYARASALLEAMPN